MISFKQKLSEEDYLSAIKEYLRHDAGSKIVFLAGTGVIIAAVILLFAGGQWYYLLGLFIVGILFLCNRLLALQSFKKTLRKSPQLFEEISVRITEGGFIELEQGEEFSRSDLKDFHQVIDSEHYLLLFPHPGIFYLIQKRHLGLEVYHHIEEILFHNIKDHKTIFQTRKH